MTVPLRAAQWIGSYFRKAGVSFPDWKEEGLLTTFGLGSLTIKELKLVYKGLVPFMDRSDYLRKPTSNAKKADWVVAVRSYFYENPECTIEKMSLLQRLPVVESSTASTTAATASTAAVSSTTTASNHNAPVVVAPNRTTTSTTAIASNGAAPSRTATSTAVAYAAFPIASTGMHPIAASWQIRPPLPPGASSFQFYNNNNNNNKRPHAENGHLLNHQEIKKEKGHNHDNNASSTVWETQPQTPQEWSMMSQLRQMGFTDDREMLAGIRHVPSQFGPTTYATMDMTAQVEAAMMWIVSQREEAEEARKEDAARVSSEQLRAEQARQRTQNANERLLNASVEEWLSDDGLFPNSILLERARCSIEQIVVGSIDKKEDVIRLLQLEKKARKWYGTLVPWCYFCNVCDRLAKKQKEESCNVSQLLSIVKGESDQLERIMYQLSEQQGGVPRLFLEARQKAKDQGLPQGPEQLSLDMDGDVVALEELSNNGNNDSSEKQVSIHNGGNSSSSAKCSGKNSSSESSLKAEVIEIL